VKLLLKNKDTEGYVLSKDDLLIGKIRLIDIVDKKNQQITTFLQDKPIILNSNISLLDAIKKLSNFVGESIPIIDKQSKKLIGIISENDVLAAYLEISDEINHIEKN
jgi:CIC family chloride channel protein